MSRIIGLLIVSFAIAARADVSVTYRVLPASYPQWPSRPYDNPGQAFTFYGNSINDYGYAAGWGQISTPGTPPLGNEWDTKNSIAIYDPSRDKVVGVGVGTLDGFGKRAYINNLNHLVVEGSSSDPVPYAPSFYNGSSFQSMGKFNGMNRTTPDYISNNDVVLGSATSGAAGEKPVQWMWTPQNGYSAVALPAGASAATISAVSVDNVFSGTVTDAATGRLYAATWTSAGGPATKLLPDAYSSFVRDANDLGQTIGSIVDADGSAHGFLLDGDKLVDLTGFSTVQISNTGVVLGGLGRTWTLYVQGQMVSLDDVLPSNYDGPDGRPYLISLDLGGNEVVATALRDGGTFETIVITVSVPEPSIVVGSCLVSGGLLLRRRRPGC